MAKLRQSTRSREPVVEQTTVRSRKRKNQEAFADDAPATDIASHQSPEDIAFATNVKFEGTGAHVPVDGPAGTSTFIKSEPDDRYESVFDAPAINSQNAIVKQESVSNTTVTLDQDVTFKPEPELSLVLDQSKPKRERKKRAIKDLSDDEEDYMFEKPKRKPVKKKQKVSEEPHRLLATPDMIRPPGEKRLPMIYPVAKKKRDSKLPSLLSEIVSSFSETARRARARIPRLEPGQEETRLLPYVDEPNEHYHAALKRAREQRLFVLQREHGVEEDCHAHHDDCPIEEFLIAGSTGNVYTVTITHKPTCTCGDWIFRRRSCKHILYILHHTLKVPDHLKHQDAFLTSELREIVEHAPPMPEAVQEEKLDNKRKPIEDDCPICCMAFEEGENVVWCEDSCGNNVHKECFEKWAQTRPHNVTCPFCRAEWHKSAPKTQTMTMTEVAMPVYRNSNGYLNVADQLGYT
ncbi:hypothetical protein AMS68_002974 [Peltaster fructicola]|uniref:SWIM-type domain-containing protein n=1 Tax=Peltaster fructicola TaxID=286661 RepID=A0A6H0XRS2_9PEZI|nr:hypothetical protein AMS68_002974 [Peltaster fructicola]